MTILITGDWHLNDNPRDEYRHQFQRRLRVIVEEHQVSTVVMLGDLTEAKEGHNAHLVNRIVQQLSLLAKLTRVIILKGNHDYIDPACPFFGFLNHLHNVEWIGQPHVLKIDKKYYTFLPHTNDWKSDWHPNFFKPSGGGHIETVFAHATFKGAISETGQVLDGVPLDAIPSGLPVIAGDVHVPQDLGRITYVGSPYTIRFGDTFKPRVLLIKDGKTISIPCPGPQKRLIEATSIESAMKQINHHPKDIVKVRIDWRGDTDKWGGARRELLDWASDKNIQLHGVEAIINGPTKTKKYTANRAQSDKEIISAYCKANNVNQVLEGVGQKIVRQMEES